MPAIRAFVAWLFFHLCWCVDAAHPGRVIRRQHYHTPERRAVTTDSEDDEEPVASMVEAGADVDAEAGDEELEINPRPRDDGAWSDYQDEDPQESVLALSDEGGEDTEGEDTDGEDTEGEDTEGEDDGEATGEARRVAGDEVEEEEEGRNDLPPGHKQKRKLFTEETAKVGNGKGKANALLPDKFTTEGVTQHGVLSKTFPTFPETNNIIEPGSTSQALKEKIQKKDHITVSATVKSQTLSESHPLRFMCSRPEDFCSKSEMYFQKVDCDNDGFPEPFCVRDDDGQTKAFSKKPTFDSLFSADAPCFISGSQMVSTGTDDTAPDASVKHSVCTQTCKVKMLNALGVYTNFCGVDGKMTWMDCDGDGITDPVCDEAGKVTWRSSRNGCSTQSTACTSCARPSTFCTSPGSAFAWKDCDGDDVPDPYCFSASGKVRFLGSTDMCKPKTNGCNKQHNPLRTISITTQGQACKDFGTDGVLCGKAAAKSKHPDAGTFIPLYVNSTHFLLKGSEKKKMCRIDDDPDSKHVGMVICDSFGTLFSAIPVKATKPTFEYALTSRGMYCRTVEDRMMCDQAVPSSTDVFGIKCESGCMIDPKRRFFKGFPRMTNEIYRYLELLNKVNLRSDLISGSATKILTSMNNIEKALKDNPQRPDVVEWNRIKRQKRLEDAQNSYLEQELMLNSSIWMQDSE